MGYNFAMKSENNQIAKEIKRRRKALGLTQEEFALRSGLGLKTVRDIEQGKLTCKMSSFLAALELLGAKFEVVDD